MSDSEDDPPAPILQQAPPTAKFAPIASRAPPQLQTGSSKRKQAVPAERRQSKAPRAAGTALPAGRRKPSGQRGGMDEAQRLALAALTAKRMRAQADLAVAEDDVDDGAAMPMRKRHVSRTSGWF